MILTDLNHPRGRADLVLLANGDIFLVGGGAGLPQNLQYGCPIFTPERFIFDPATGEGEWVEEDDHDHPRMYHSVTLMLPDGSVWAAGQHENSECDSKPIDQAGLTVEIYKPWYFDHDRPVITSAPPADPTQPIERGGDPFEVEYLYSKKPHANIAFVALRSLDSVTHSVNMSQRYVILNHIDHPTKPDTLLVTPPPVEFAPPGPYMLIIVDDYEDTQNLRFGVPSEAVFIYLE